MSNPPQDLKEVEQAESRSKDFQVSRLLMNLDEEGCPICRETSGSDKRYFFWFFHENHGTLETLDVLTRSLGFCSAHGAQAVLHPIAQSPLTAVHEVLARRIGPILSREASTRERGKDTVSVLAASDRCPACRNRDKAVGRAASFLAAGLNDPSGMDRYAHPGLLCFPHLQAIAPRLSAPVLGRILNVHESTMVSAMESFTNPHGITSGTSSLEWNDPDSTIMRALHLVADNNKRLDLYPIGRISGGSPAARDPVGDFLETLPNDDACPVCMEVCRAWTEWMEWLEDAIPRGWEVKDILPTCPEHVRAAVHRGNAPLAVESVRKIVSAVLDQIRLGIEILAPSSSPDRGRIMLRIGHAIWGSNRRLRVTRDIIGRPLPCPVCSRLAVARDRIFTLLFALLDTPHYRTTFERGYGLCLKHFSRAMVLRPPHAVRTILAEVEAARLARLQWELEESLRKDAWMYRPEAPGTEHTAWRRAVHRFSGSFYEGN